MKFLLICFATVLVTACAMAETRPFNMSLTPDIAVYNRFDTIEGVTLSIWGQNSQRSLALGFANGTTGRSEGVCLGILNYADNYKGVQLGAVNYTKDDSIGWGDEGYLSFIVSGFNYTGGAMKGFYAALVNWSGNLTGLEIGIVNYTESSDSGLQIGLINIVKQNNSWFDDMPHSLAPWMILVNW